MITIKTAEEIEIIAEGSQVLAKIIKELEKEVKPGIATNDLDGLAEALILRAGGKCSFKGYQGFPNCLCTSINEEVVHGIPSGRILKEGDIIKLDLGVFYKGYHSDMAMTVPVGEVSFDAKRLIWATKKALKRGIKKIKPGNTFSDIGNTIQRYVESQGLNVVRDLCGHGIGRELHEDPQILNYGKRHTGPEIKEGMVFCLEPMVTLGGWKIKIAKDGYGYQTADSSLSAHFEHTIAITKNGVRVLTEYA
ncbi:MAG: type I methionyl aminopeptidase [Candidatus Nealsonbacteria bacterium CG08_land_8_20_14_0_20_38_20]|uniref:Methionine aminopeptidase n=1 Tax=Candidatus Nealsonbacteria bacterium CG08_land_8_20_14_0_20_38_20 TaxID=1974705 RepID=A0A2H0YND2_9BACT|nr:MAG: type I methionyl aminopeptidase [Candidatus Nealsonbacteria bacterium CG08_land_8_20_14_0_20_38_20]